MMGWAGHGGRTLLAVAAFIAAAGPALACRAPSALNMEDIRNADAVFVGIASGFDPYTGEDAALLSLDTVETLYGAHRDFWNVKLWSGGSGYPRLWDRTGPLIVAVIDPVLRMAGENPDIEPLVGAVYLSAILQMSCAPPFIFDDTPEIRAEIARVMEAAE